MNIKEFFEICEDFFDQLNPNIVQDYEVEEVEKVQKTSDELLEEGEEICLYKLFYLMIDTLLLINPKKFS